MRTSILTRGGAMLTAAALTLTLSAGPATAADSSQPAVTADAAASRSGTLATGADVEQGSTGARIAGRYSTKAVSDVLSMKAYSTQLFRADENYIDVDVFVPNPDDPDIDYFELALSVGGVNKGLFRLYYDPELEQTYVVIPGNIGLGKAKFTGAVVHYSSGSALPDTVDTTASNTFYVRKYIDSKDPALKIIYSSKKKSFYVKGVKIFVPSTGTYKSLGKIKLQRKSSSKGKWSTKKTINLDGNGNGNYWYKTKTKYYYRIYAPVSDTSGGFYTKTSKKL